MEQRVLLINMPFGGVDRPAIGISTLKAALMDRGIHCEIRYLNFLWAQMVGTSLFKWYIDRAPYMIFAGEWMFATEFFGRSIPTADAYYEFLRKAGVDDAVMRVIAEMRQKVRPFLDRCLAMIPWADYSIVGFTSTFEQNVASLALAHAVKSSFPKTTIAMGGANCDDNMGVSLHRQFPFLDYVFTGPSEHTFPDFVERLSQERDFTDIPGIAYRLNKETQLTAPAGGTRGEMDSFPIPDYSEYFSQMKGTDIAQSVPIRLQIETSRGCWWGMKQHCTFCGFNASSMRFLTKSEDRVLTELQTFVERYGVRGVDAVDSIMDMRFFRGLLPRLRDSRLGVSLFYEIKANLTKSQVQLLSQAGVIYIQPGIESLHSKVLKLMKKGVSALQNIQLLKWCKQFGVAPTWNLLYGFPGEEPNDYDEQLNRIYSLFHLPPPGGTGRLRMDRFSPHYDQAKEFGFTNVRPVEAYRYIYPLSISAISEIGYYFDYDYADGKDPASYIRDTNIAIMRWREAATRGATLELKLRRDRGITLIDRRELSTPRTIELNGWQSVIYKFCEQARSIAAVRRLATEQKDAPDDVVSEVDEFMERMVNDRLMARDDSSYLGLAVGLPLSEELEIPSKSHLDSKEADLELSR